MHAILKVITNLINKHFMAINMYTLMFLLISYVTFSWLGLTFANEPHLTDNLSSVFYYSMWRGIICVVCGANGGFFF